MFSDIADNGLLHGFIKLFKTFSENIFSIKHLLLTASLETRYVNFTVFCMPVILKTIQKVFKNCLSKIIYTKLNMIDSRAILLLIKLYC